MMLTENDELVKITAVGTISIPKPGKWNILLPPATCSKALQQIKRETSG